MDCFWPRCSNHKRCEAHGSCVAKAQAGGATFPKPETDPWTLEYAIGIATIGHGKSGYRVYPGSGGIWCGNNEAFADATFEDWGLARATAIILNAVIAGRLKP